MKKLKELLKNYRAIADEIVRTRLMASESQAKIDGLVALDDFNSEKNQRKLADARSSLDIATARLRHIGRADEKLAAEILAEYKVQRPAFNAVVGAYGAQKTAELESALRPFYLNGTERQLKEAAAGLYTPVRRSIQKAMFSASFGAESTVFDKVAIVESFVAHAEKTLKKFGLQPAEG